MVISVLMLPRTGAVKIASTIVVGIPAIPDVLGIFERFPLAHPASCHYDLARAVLIQNCVYLLEC